MHLVFGKGLETCNYREATVLKKYHDSTISITSPAVATPTPEVLTPLLKALHPFPQLRLLFYRIIGFSLRFNIDGLLSRPGGDCHVAAIDAV